MSQRTNTGGNSPLFSRRAVAILIVALFLSLAAIGYITVTSKSVDGETLPIVELGDTVYVTYVGRFVDNPGGWVFDTNDRAVATNKSIAKSLYFLEREAEQYTPLNFSAGKATNLLKPFVDGVLGMSAYQTKKISIPVEDAYTILEENIEYYPLILEVPIIQNITYTEFKAAYNLNPYIGLQFKQQFWGWEASVLDIRGDKIFLRNQPAIGAIISSFGNPETDSRDGWYQEVLGIDSSAENGTGIIQVKNFIKEQDVYQKKGTNYDGRQFTLIEVNETAGYFAVIYNTESYIGELAGRALVFEVTVTGVKKN